MTKAEISRQTEEDIKADGKYPKDDEALHQVGIARVELRQL